MLWSLRLGKKRKEYVRDKPYDWAIVLVTANREDGIIRALDSVPDHIRNEFKPLAPLIFRVLKEKRHPKRLRSRLDYLADSIAARGDVSPRRSRDICAKARAVERAKSPYKIVRHEYYVGCSCGYKGPARDNACRKCGAQINLLPEMMWGIRAR